MLIAVARAHSYWHGDPTDVDGVDDGDDDETAAAAERLIDGEVQSSSDNESNRQQTASERPSVQFLNDSSLHQAPPQAMEIDSRTDDTPTSLPILRTHHEILRVSPIKHRRHTVRYEMKLKVGATQSRGAMEEAVRERISNAFSLIAKADARACVMPWRKEDWEMDWLQKPSEFPHGIEPLQFYFDERIYAPRNGGFIFPNVFLAHVMDPYKLNGAVQQLF